MFGKKTREINELKARVDELLKQLDSMSGEHVKELANYKTACAELNYKVDELTNTLDSANAEIARLKHKKAENAAKKAAKAAATTKAD